MELPKGKWRIVVVVLLLAGIGLTVTGNMTKTMPCNVLGSLCMGAGFIIIAIWNFRAKGVFRK
jgi:hypothetical protein